uniref:Uncharacterized protein n=1 Tax=uncultured nuHF1 cluster bacterium HF0130_31E21 TaxID=710728 RepID=E0XTJ9_9BACT|nr:hypothetical protein [uncultured nuHF1 cluster bacterium HF0130_31E21]
MYSPLFKIIKIYQINLKRRLTVGQQDRINRTFASVIQFRRIRSRFDQN